MKMRISFSMVSPPRWPDAPPPHRRWRCLAGCGSDGDGTVVATTTQVADLARNVAGDSAAVSQILTPNADPHGYEPRARDVKRLVGAKLVLRSGGEVDDWLEEAQASAGSDARVVTLGENTREEPHWWQDPRAAIAAVAKVRDGLAEVDPDHRAAYDADARALHASRCARSTGDRPLHRDDPAGAAQACHDPRRARRLRAALRPRGDRHGDPVALDPRAGVGG